MRRRIFAIATDSAGCFLYRLHWPLTHLNPDEFQVIWGPPDQTRRHGDVVIGQRIAGHNPAWLELCADPAILAVYDIDDDLTNIDPANAIPYSIYHPQRDDTIRNIAASDVVTCSTWALGAVVRQWNDNVIVLPNCLPDEWFNEPDHRHHDGTITIGWAGSPFHEHDWAGVAAQLAMLTDARIRWHMIGADYTGGLLAVRPTPWAPMPYYLRALDFDIGIAPSKITEFNGCKSHAKLLEYGARGIPAVAPNWGEYGTWITAGATRDADAGWAAAITPLLDDTIRGAASQAASARANQYRITNHVHRWANVYTQTPRSAR